jgi:hypothetical protein
MIAFVLVSFITNAQSKQEDFEKAVDYCACKIAYSYTNQYANKNTNSQEKKSFDEKIKPKIENCKIDNPIQNSVLLELLKNNNFDDFAGKLTPAIEQAKESFQNSFTKEKAVNSIINIFYGNESLKTVILTYTSINDIRKKLKDELGAFLSSFPNSHSNNKEKEKETKANDKKHENLVNKIVQLESLIEKNKRNGFSPNWLSLILIIIFAIILFALIKFKTEDLKDRLDRHRRNIDALQQSKENNQTHFNISNNNQFEKSVNRNISDLNDSISKLQNEVSILSENKITKNEVINIQQPVQRQEKKKEILFAPAPNSDGSFNSSVVLSTENQSSSFYKFTLLDGFPQKAEFEFINSERAIKDALSSYELILKPVCKFNNALNQNAKKITTLKAGLVEKQNDKWIVKQKAEITYE